jgi:hypothetical protein
MWYRHNTPGRVKWFSKFLWNCFLPCQKVRYFWYDGFLSVTRKLYTGDFWVRDIQSNSFISYGNFRKSQRSSLQCFYKVWGANNISEALKQKHQKANTVFCGNSGFWSSQTTQGSSSRVFERPVISHTISSDQARTCSQQFGHILYMSRSVFVPNFVNIQ